MGAFKVLMWKHFVVRKRRYIQTFIELATPFAMILILFILKKPMEDKTKGSSTTLNQFPVSRFSLDYTVPPTGIIYSPDSEAARKLMQEVTNSLSKSKFRYNNDWRKKIIARSLPISDVSLAVEALLMIARRSKNIYAMVEFEDMEGSELPDTLKYTIRMTSLIAYGPTVKFQRMFEKFGTENVPQSFLPLQWAIDTSYLKLKSNSSVEQKVIFEPLGHDEPLKRTLNKTYISTVFFLLTYISFGAPLLPFVFLMSRLLEERATGIQELVKMVGVTPTMLNFTQFLNALPACLIYCIGGVLLLKATDTPMVPMTNGFIIFIGQLLHFISMIVMAFTCSHMARDAQHTVSMSVFAYIGMWIPIRLIGYASKSDVYLFFHGLCPHCPSFWILNEALVAEVRYESGIQFDKLNHRFSVHPDGGRNASVMVAYIMQLIQIFYFFLISWFLEKIRPGKYGIALPWNFLFKKEYWSKNRKVPEISNEGSTPYDSTYQKYFEEPPIDVPVGIRIQHVSKIFGSGKKSFQALNDVNLDIYKGEITVLLGHNGAGKTTLISIITGLINPTAGKVYVNNLDTVTEQIKVRKHLGFCPQHNLFFPDLTMLEHLMFFSLIKGGTFEEAKLGAYSLMDQLDLILHANKKTAELSGGLLRRLQLACALCGNASVLILDEPTSGLDVEARRELWDTLLSLRGDRTLVLTTHFMEEADVLGDRIAALHLGKLRCHATPIFLKKAVGSGFHVTITTLNSPEEDKLTLALQELLPGIMLINTCSKVFTYALPPESILSTFFKSLEERKEELNIDTIEVGVATLEEVFLELCCDVDTVTDTETFECIRRVEFQYLKGYRLIWRQIKQLIKRQIDYTLSTLFSFILLHIVMPFVLCTSLTQIFNILDNEKNQDLSLNLDMYSDAGLTQAVCDIKTNATRRAVTDIAYAYPLYQYRSLKEKPYAHSLTLAESSGGARVNWDKYYVGIYLNDTVAKILYTEDLKHSAPVGLNLLSNIMSIQKLPNAHGKTIVTKITNHWPMLSKSYHVPKSQINCSLFAVFNICTIIATTLNDLSLPCKERLTVARHTHIMAGCSPILYWLVTFLFHMTCYICFCCTAALTAAAFFDYDKTIDDRYTLTAIFVVLLLNGMNTFAFMYFISFCANERTASLLLVGFLTIFGFITPMLILAVEDLKTYPEETAFSKIMNKIGLFIPVFMFTMSLIEVTDTARFNSFCINNIQKCPHLIYYAEGFDAVLCCTEGSESKGPFNHFAFNQYAAGKSVIIIFVQFVFFSTLVMLCQYGVFNRLWNYTDKLCKLKYPKKVYNNPKVVAEKNYVSNHIGREKSKNTLLVDRVWKVYRGLLGRPTFAVKGASFSVKEGECFGILGLNGAGKTTTFKLISKEESLSQGKIHVNGHSTHSREYLRCLGYCPQFCGLDFFRSGAENLRMLLIFRGLSDIDVMRETKSWLDVVGMTKYAKRVVSGYSGGMVRRLATAASLCSGAPLTLLDEPTAGVDTAARRLVWAALRRGLRHKRSIAISSHCMDEMERLCNRVTILSLGEMSVLGTPQSLKDQYSVGYNIILKLHADSVQAEQEQMKHLQRALEHKFNCVMKYTHLTSFHYHINKKLPYSEIFAGMEEILKDYGNLIEDYSVTNTSLEDVFHAFAFGGEAERTPHVSKETSVKVENKAQSNYELKIK